MFKIISLVFLIFTGSTGCDGKPKKSKEISSTDPDSLNIETTKQSEDVFAYQLDQPNETFKLESILQEISGLGISSSGDFLYAVQDENGVIFRLDRKTGAIIERTKFHKDGDYEGIESVGDKIYVVKSTGTIYEVSNLGMPDQAMKKYNFFLSKENDVEGLAYDKKNNRLLLACKGVPATGESFEVIRMKKVIYAFDLDSLQLIPDPIYTIHLDHIRKYLEQHTSLKEYEKLLEFFSAGKENLTFNPSALAIHPITNQIYVISSSGKVMIVMNESGDVIHVEKLKKSIHAQPEGIIFDKDGTLYISNEGKGGTPKIHQFSYMK